MPNENPPVKGPLCGKRTHFPCIVGCRKPCGHSDPCQCEHQMPKTSRR